LRSGHLRPRAALLAAWLVAAWTAGTANAATPAVLSQRAAAMADAISVDWSRSLNASGLIVDPFTGQPEGGYGRTFLAYGMLRAQQRDPAFDLSAVLAHALQNPGAARCSGRMPGYRVEQKLLPGVHAVAEQFVNRDEIHAPVLILKRQNRWARAAHGATRRRGYILTQETDSRGGVTLRVEHEVLRPVSDVTAESEAAATRK
jgi:hypothetical protein